MKEKIICLSTPSGRIYYRAETLAKEFLDKDRTLINKTGSIPDGEVEEFETNIKTVKHYKHEKLDGSLAIIDLTTGKETLRETYCDGILTNVAEPSAAADTPKPNYEGTVFRTNKKTQSFYVNGKEVAERTLGPDGRSLELLGTIPNGPAKEFDDNGQLRCEAVYLNNQLQGTVMVYDEKGRLISQENYEQDRLNGPAEYYSYCSLGALKTAANYVAGQLNGPWTLFFANGKERVNANYKNGKLHGLRRALHKDGQPAREENYENGKLHGPRTLYFPEGSVWYRENYKNGRLDGARESFFRSGKKRSSEYYTDGLLEGERLVYSESGELLVNENYHWGTLVHNTERQKCN